MINGIMFGCYIANVLRNLLKWAVILKVKHSREYSMKCDALKLEI